LEILELISLKNGLYSLLNLLKDDTILKDDLDTLKIQTDYISNYHYKLLFNNWEYRNFRGVPNADLWKEIWDLFQQLNDINITVLHNTSFNK
jgi:ribonuclease HI